MKTNITKAFFSLIFVFAAFFATEAAAQDQVFVTKNGTKYHKKDCQHVKGKPDAAPIALTKAKTDRLEACKSCFIEDKKANGKNKKDEKKPENKGNKPDDKGKKDEKKPENKGSKTDDKGKKDEKKPDTGKKDEKTNGGK